MTSATADRTRAIPLETGDRARRAIPDGTLRALVAGGEAALLGWLAVVVPAVAAYVATASAPALGEATWLGAAVVGTGVWRLAHGGVVTLAGEPVTLVPLGLSLLAGALVSFAARRARVRNWTALGAVVVGYSVPAAALASVPETAVGGWTTTLLGAAVIASLGGGFALLRAGDGRWPPPAAPVRAVLARLPEAVPRTTAGVGGAVLRGGASGVVGLAVVGGVLVAGSVLAHVEEVRAAFGLLAEDGMSTAMMLLATALYLPVLAVWAVAWAVGPGFAVGEGTLVSSAGVSLAPVPAFPAFAALPEAGTAAAWAPWAPLTLLVVGIWVGWRLHRRDRQQRLWATAASAVGAATLTALATWALADLAAGGIGPGRMAHFGPEPTPVAVAAGLWVGAGALAVALAARPDTVALATRTARTAWSGTRAALEWARQAALRAWRSIRPAG